MELQYTAYVPGFPLPLVFTHITFVLIIGIGWISVTLAIVPQSVGKKRIIMLQHPCI